ncbi:MBL fold metallo-hydrolase [Acidobacteriota bacterium]
MSAEKLIVLGSGCGVPNPGRGSPGLLLSCRDRRVLIDAGPGTAHRASCAGTELKDIDLLLLTHLHLDHITEVPFLLFSLRIAFVEPREKPFTIVGPEGLSEHYRKLTACYDNHVRPKDYELAIVEAGQGARTIAGFGLEAFPTEHTENSQGYRIKTPEGRIVAVSGDTDICPEIVELGRNADLLVLECSMPDDMKAEGHLTPSEAGRIAAQADARRLLLVHMYPCCDGTDITLQVSKEYPGQIIKGEDGLVIDL